VSPGAFEDDGQAVAGSCDVELLGQHFPADLGKASVKAKAIAWVAVPKPPPTLGRAARLCG
jgi:hypothetical protein